MYRSVMLSALVCVWCRQWDYDDVCTDLLCCLHWCVCGTSNMTSDLSLEHVWVGVFVFTT